MSKNSSRRLKIIINVITLVALGVLIFALWDQIVETFQNLGRVNLWFLATIPFLQFFNYHAYTQMYRGIFAFFNERIRYRSMFRVQLELNFVNNVFPSGGVTGISYFGLRMRDADVSAGKSTLVQLMKFILIFISFEIFLGIGLLFLAIGGQANNLLILIAGSVATLLFVVTALLMYIVGSKRRINSFFTQLTKLINKIIFIVPKTKPETINVEKVRALFEDLHESYLLIKKDPKAMKRPFMHAMSANATEIATVYMVYLAFGAVINPGAVIIAYGIANFAGMVSVLPGGIGVYEALMTAVLVAAGVPVALSLPVTVMYRVVSSFIQLVPGYYYYHKALHSGTSHAKS